MKVLIVSDTHGSFYGFEEAFSKEKPVDLVLHLGDIQADREELEWRTGCDCRVVAGNMDAFSRLPDELTFGIGNVTVHMEHGNWPPFIESKVEERAARYGADIMMYGHTHRPMLKKVGKVTLLNPGSLSRPRQADGRRSYAVMTVEGNKEPTIVIKYVD